jgi:Transglycosylase SLT domain
MQYKRCTVDRPRRVKGIVVVSSLTLNRIEAFNQLSRLRDTSFCAGAHLIDTRRYFSLNYRVLVSSERQGDGMKAQIALMRICLCTVGATLCSAATSADIFRSEGQDGVVRYASQPLDASYRIYLRDDPSHRGALPSRRASSALPRRLDEVSSSALIEKLSRKYAVDPALVRAIIEVESNGNPTATSSKGAIGAMQLMPATAAMYGVTDRADPAQNIDAGIRHLKYLLGRYGGNVALSLAAFNAGEGAVARHAARIPPYRETMLYVPAVLARMQFAHNQPVR